MVSGDDDDDDDDDELFRFHSKKQLLKVSRNQGDNENQRQLKCFGLHTAQLCLGGDHQHQGHYGSLAFQK